MLEKYLIDYCSPTLAGLKTANLFSYPFDSEITLMRETARAESLLSQKGLHIAAVRIADGSALMYVYRFSKLQTDLDDESVRSFLSVYGYFGSVDDMIGRMSERLNMSEGFPHEIGLFLSYPLADVVGFIENKGDGCKCVGFWKVYDDEAKAKLMFCRFKKCREIYRRLWNNGKSVSQLIVAA